MQGTDSIRLVLGPDQLRVGGTSAVGGDYFAGWLQGVIMPSGTAVIADRRGRTVFVLFANGRQGRLAASGEGPGEIRVPTALFRIDNEQVGVVDSRLRRVSKFVVRADTVAFVSSSDVPGQPAAACSGDSSFYGLEYSDLDTTSLAEFFFEGGPARRMGMPLATGSRLRNAQLTRGAILCALQAGQVWVSPLTGDLIAFDLAGVLTHKLSIPEFVPGLVRERNGTILVGVVDPERGWSRIPVGLVVIDGFVGAIQLQEYSLAEGQTEPVTRSLLTTLFDIRTGRRLGVQEDVPRILSSSGGKLLLATDGDEPTVSIVEYALKKVR